MLPNTVSHNSSVRQTAAHLVLARHVQARHDAWQSAWNRRIAANRQRLTAAICDIKAQHGRNWQRYSKTQERPYDVIVFGDPFAEDAVTVELKPAVTVIKRYGCAPDYHYAISARDMFALLRS